MLIDTREHRPEPPGPDPIDIDWRLVGWVALCLALFVAAREVPSGAGVVLALGGLLALFKILIVVTEGNGRGIRDWRQ